MISHFYYIKRIFLTLISLALTTLAIGQNRLEKWTNSKSIEHEKLLAFPLFSLSDEAEDKRTSGAISVLNINSNSLKEINSTRPDFISIEIPTGKTAALKLNLAQVQIFSPDFELGELNNGKRTMINKDCGIYFRGTIENEPGSLVALSIHQNDLNGWICTRNETYELIPEKTGSNTYLLKNPLKSYNQPAFTCETSYPPGYQKQTEGNQTQGIGCKSVSIYFECDNKLYKDFNSSTSAVMNYVTAVFNQVATLYQNENIDILISGINIWTTPDPYANYTSISEILGVYKNTRGNNFNGNLSQLLTTRQLGGGISYMDVLCNKNYAHGACCIYPTYNNAPTYSWTVEVISHELGHGMGSNHTHWCGWQRTDGSTGALDNCFTSEGGCAPGPSPVNGGTIMSYCHLTGGGINFSNGFGTIPGDFIRSRVLNASCVIAGGVFPGGLKTGFISSTAAKAQWNSIGSSSNYTVEFREAGTPTWMAAGTTSNPFLTMNHLNKGATYEWHVKTECSGFSPATRFSTLKTDPCSSPSAINVTSTSGTTAMINWNNVTDANRYTIQFRPVATASWTTIGSTGENQFLVTGLNGTTDYFCRVKADCSTYSDPMAFSTAATGCPTPLNLTMTNLTNTGVRLSWSNADGATQYTVSYKPVTETRWNSVLTAQNGITLVGLSPGIAYDWKVKSNCSANTPSVSFQTIAALPNPASVTSLETVQLSPNPATTKITLLVNTSSDFGTPAYVSISNLIGKTELTVPFDGLQLQLDIAELPDGVYIARIIDTSGRILNKRFVKR
jgi:hypothetical protein